MARDAEPQAFTLHHSIGGKPELIVQGNRYDGNLMIIYAYFFFSSKTCIVGTL